MIKIIRGPVPKFLRSEKILSVRRKIEEDYNKLDRQERLKFDFMALNPIKEDLRQQFNNKCAYCESSFGAISHGEIEHFRPKGGARGLDKDAYAPMHYWWLAYEWSNLLITCQMCSSKYKRDYFPIEDEKLRSAIGATGDDLIREPALLIDPCLDAPEDHLVFHENGLVSELSKKGKVTIEILGLNRQELVYARKKAADSLKFMLAILTEVGEVQDNLSDVILGINEIFSTNTPKEYLAVQRAVFGKWYEDNSAFWENLNNNQATTNRPHKSKPNHDTNQEINEINEKLHSIKRFSIKRIEIENFKSIEKLKLDFLPVNQKDDRESWLLLLGDNGIGKSSILQAIALALAGKKQLSKLNLDVNDFLKRGTKDGYVKVHSYEHDTPIILKFDQSGFKTDVSEAPTFVMAYGSTRLLPNGKIEPDNHKEPYLNIRNLFDYSTALNDPNKWLATIEDVEFKERVAPVFFDVLSLKGEDRLGINNRKITIQQFGETYDLEDNSDGYKTITALVSDIMQTLSIEQAHYHNSQGIVLIDEIGNHLHPRWRMKIVSALRRAFPRLQFIVTTHEPLCLRGLCHGEVVVLTRDENKKVRALDSSLLPDHNLMRIEQLLTSDLFGLINVLDEETEKTYEEYYALLSKKNEERTEEEKMKIEELSEVLSNQEMLGNTPREQILYKMIDETYAQKIRNEGFKTTEELKEETVNQVKTYLINKKIDWL